MSNVNLIYDIERLFLSKLLASEDINLLHELQIKPSFFTREYATIFNWVLVNVERFNTLPSLRTTKREFADFQEDIITDSIEYLADQLRDKVTQNLITDAMEESRDLLLKRNPKGALAEFRKMVESIELEVSYKSAIVLGTNIEARLKRYEEREKSGGIIGIHTGFSFLDNTVRGWIPQTLSVVIATTSVGKTFFNIISAVHAAVLGYRVLFLTTEMPIENIQDRIEGVFYSKRYGNFDYQNYLKGKLSLADKDKFKAFMTKDVAKFAEDNRFIISDAQDVISISSDMQKYKPDIVFLDGIYLMDDILHDREERVRISNISKGIHELAKRYKVPIIANNQANGETYKKTGPGLENMAYSKAVGNHSDNVLGMYRTPQMRDENECGVLVLKNREGPLNSFVINWDFDKMNFDCIYSESKEASFAPVTEGSQAGVLEMEEDDYTITP